MQKQQCLLAAAPRKKKEASPSPWWDFLGHCKEAVDSSDSEDDTPQQNDDMTHANYDDMMCTSCPKNSANDDLIIKESAPLSPGSIVRTTPVKLISARSNGSADGVNDVGAVRPDTPGTHDSSFSSSETSSSCSSIADHDNVDHDDDGGEVPPLHSIGVDVGDIDHIEEGEEECNLIGGITAGSLISSSQASSPLQMIATSSVVFSPPTAKDTTQYMREHQPLQLLQSISEEEEEQSNSDDDNFIGNIDVTAISPFLSTKQRNIRKNAYDLLKRLGEEVLMFDLNSVEAKIEREEEEEDSYIQQQRQKKQQLQMEAFEEVDGLRRQLGECTDMVVQLQENLRIHSNTTNNGDDVTSVGIIKDDDNENNDIVADLHAEIANLKSQLQSAMLQSTQDASQIQSLESQLQQALHELSHHLNKQREYEETIESVNEAVVRSHLYNKEIVKELMISRKENDDLTMRLLDKDKESEQEEDEEDNDDLLKLEHAIAATTVDGKNEVLEASFADDASLTMTCDQVPSVFRRQHPLSVLQDHLLSCIKLPLRVLSILFSVWIAIVLIRIVLVFSLIFVDHNRNSLLEDGFNVPGIY
eukprot:scaffold4591_cov80-Skeletonema_menzelii.AAC.1